MVEIQVEGGALPHLAGAVDIERLPVHSLEIQPVHGIGGGADGTRFDRQIAVVDGEGRIVHRGGQPVAGCTDGLARSELHGSRVQGSGEIRIHREGEDHRPGVGGAVVCERLGLRVPLGRGDRGRGLDAVVTVSLTDYGDHAGGGDGGTPYRMECDAGCDDGVFGVHGTLEKGRGSRGTRTGGDPGLASGGIEVAGPGQGVAVEVHALVVTGEPDVTRVDIEVGLSVRIDERRTVVGKPGTAGRQTDFAAVEIRREGDREHSGVDAVAVPRVLYLSRGIRRSGEGHLLRGFSDGHLTALGHDDPSRRHPEDGLTDQGEVRIRDDLVTGDVPEDRGAIGGGGEAARIADVRLADAGGGEGAVIGKTDGDGQVPSSNVDRTGLHDHVRIRSREDRLGNGSVSYTVGQGETPTLIQDLHVPGLSRGDVELPGIDGHRGLERRFSDVAGINGVQGVVIEQVRADDQTGIVGPDYERS